MAFILDDLIISCSVSGTEHNIIKKIIMVESNANPIAININTLKGMKRYSYKIPTNEIEAASIVSDAVSKGYTVDIGYMQVNTTNLKSLGYNIKDMFDPCKNIAAGTRIYKNFHTNAKNKFNTVDVTKYALSAYNTGNYLSGLNNGYVEKFGIFSSYKTTSNLFNETAIIVNYNNVTKDKVMKTLPELSENKNDAQIPGTQIIFTPEEAEANGAFLESALSEDDAWDSNIPDTNNIETTAIVVSGKKIGK